MKDMVIEKKLGRLEEFSPEDRRVDTVHLAWFETDRRLLHKRSSAGENFVLRSLTTDPQWSDGDVIFVTEDSITVIRIDAVEAISIEPDGPAQMAWACYEIGNKHLPLFYENGKLLVPFEKPVLHLLEAAGLKPVVVEAKLVNRLKSSVLPHGHGGQKTESLFSKIMKLAGHE